MLERIKKAFSGKVFLQALFVGLLGVTGAFLYNVTDLMLATQEELAAIQSQYSEQLSALLISSVFSTFLLVFIAYIVGYKTRQKLKLERHKTNKIECVVLIVVTVAISVLLYVLDYKIFYNNIKYFVPIVFNPVELLTTIVNGITVEEVVLRYGLTSLVIYLFYNVFSKRDEKGNKLPITKTICIAGVIFSALFLFLFQFGEVTEYYGQGILIFIRSFINYFCIGTLLNYIYVKYSLKWSMLLHTIFLIVYTGICPLVLYLVI